VHGASYKENQAGHATHQRLSVESASRIINRWRVRLLRAWEGADRNRERSG
jgi:hypothetical protein